MSQVIGQTRLAYSRSWHLINLSSDPRPLGRIASQIALTLMGKHKPMYDPSTDCGDYVVALGCHELHVTGKKRAQKTYYTHTTRPGSLKAMSMEKLIAKWGGGEVLRRAVSGMLPKNRLREKRLARLKAFEGLAHPFQANIIGARAPPRKTLNIPKMREGFREAWEAEAAEKAAAAAAKDL